jgi:hypothetical protein
MLKAELVFRFKHTPARVGCQARGSSRPIRYNPLYPLTINDEAIDAH